MEGSSSNSVVGQDANWRSQMSSEYRLRAVELMFQKIKEVHPNFPPQKFCAVDRVLKFLEEKTYMTATSKENYVQRIMTQTDNKSTSGTQEQSKDPQRMQKQRFRDLIVAAHKKTPNDLQGQFTRDQRTAQKASAVRRRSDQENQSKKYVSPDRISNLPVELLEHIMSFISTLDAVHTSVLSPQWRDRWTYVPCLILDVDQFRGHRENFSNFVNRVLHLRNRTRPLNLFHLRSSEIGEANVWINEAIRNKAKVVEFSEDLENVPFRLERSIVNFTSSNLTRLLLDNVQLDPLVFDPVNSSCPALQRLELRESSLEITEISSSSLLHLSINNCILFENLLISGPCIEYLSIKDPRDKAPMVKILPSLVEAVITLDEFLHSSNPMEEDQEEEEEDGADANYSLFEGLKNARNLKLIAPQREAIFNWEIPKCPMFNNLTSLMLGEWCMTDEFAPLLYMLSQSPLLENLTLILNKEVCRVCCEVEAVAVPRVGAFTADNLRKVTIYFRLGDERVQALLKLLAPIAKSFDDIELKPSQFFLRLGSWLQC